MSGTSDLSIDVDESVNRPMSEQDTGPSEESSSRKRGGPSQKAGYTTDHMGKPSMMRAMCAVALATSIVFGLIILIRPILEDGVTSDFGFNGIYLTTAFLVAAFAPKAVQKFAEAQFPSPGSK